MQNYQQTVLSQFAASPVLQQLLSSANDYFDPAYSFEAFLNNVWDISTAVGYGLDVWGRILNVDRVLQVSTAGTFVGFEESTDPGAVGFNQGPFFSGGSVTSNYNLSDDEYRTLLYAKALANICDGSTPGINAVLMLLFSGRGDAYVIDGENLTMVYNFTFTLTAVEQAIVSQSGVLPRPSGVDATVAHP